MDQELVIFVVSSASISKWVSVQNLCQEYQFSSILKVEKITITKRLTQFEKETKWNLEESILSTTRIDH